MPYSRESLEVLTNQVFYNHLIFDEIWNYLPQTDLVDLLNYGLVNKLWQSKALEILKRVGSIIKISGGSPCQTLKRINDVLEGWPDDLLPFKGVQFHYQILECPENTWPDNQLFRDQTFHTPTLCNQNCLGDSPQNCKDLYSNILKKVEFQVVHFENVQNPNCPFVHFLMMILKERPSEIRELNFCGIFCSQEINLSTYLNLEEATRADWFSNLQIFQFPLPKDIDMIRALICAAPKLTKIKGYYGSGCYSCIQHTVPAGGAQRSLELPGNSGVPVFHLSTLAKRSKDYISVSYGHGS